MADDMANSNDASRHYQDAITAQMGERITNLGRRQNDLESEMRSGFKQMESAIASLALETRNSISTLSTSISERSRPQWQALGVTLTFAGMVGALAYMPIREATNDLKSSVSLLADKMVTRQEMDWRTARGTEDRQRTDQMINDIRKDLVPRSEHAREWAGADQRFVDIQRQVDDIKQAEGAVYGQRDLLIDLKDRLNRLEREKEQQLK